MMRKMGRIISDETYGFDLRWLLAQMLMLPFPLFTGVRLRALIMRLFGFQIGSGTVILGTPMISGGKQLHKKFSVGNDTIISVGCFFDLAAPIKICERVGISPGCMLITGTHEIGSRYMRLGKLDPKPITVGDGVWLGSRCTILPGITVGEGAIVAAGAVVTKNVPPNTLVAGVPATVIRELPQNES